jgi:hypothetical protein
LSHSAEVNLCISLNVSYADGCILDGFSRYIGRHPNATDTVRVSCLARARRHRLFIQSGGFLSSTVANNFMLYL